MLNEPFPAHLRSVGAARRAVCAALAEWGWDDRSDDAAQVVTELATNAVLHAGTPFTVTVTAEEGVLRVAVADGSPRRPVRRRGSAQATTGRGLVLVSELSTAWGVDDDPAGKTVWCLLTGTALPAGGGTAEASSTQVAGRAGRRAAPPGGRDGGRRAPGRSRGRSWAAVPPAA